MVGIKTFLSNGIFSFFILLWTIISIVLIALLYKRSNKSVILLTGTLLGSIIFMLGAHSYFSGLPGALRLLPTTSYLDIENMIFQVNSQIRVPFSISTIFTILYFVLLSIVIMLKKAALRKWSIWLGLIIFILCVPIHSYMRYSMNLKLLGAFGKMTTTLNQIPTFFYPFVKTGRIILLTSILLSVVYLLVAILLTIRKKKKSAPQENTSSTE